jgi:hypothetical protein
MLFFNKYLEGSIYTNFYLDGVAGIVSAACCSMIYNKLRTRLTFIISLSLACISGLIILSFEKGLFNPELAFTLGLSDKCPDQDEFAQREFYLKKIVPIFGMVAKFGLNMSFQSAYLASFSNVTVFPQDKRATAIGICNFIARTLTIFSSLVAESP